MCTKLTAATRLRGDSCFPLSEESSAWSKGTPALDLAQLGFNRPCQWSPRWHSGNHFFLPFSLRIVCLCHVFEGWKLFSTMDGPSHGRVAVIKTSLRWGLNTQNKHAGKGDVGCLRFPRYHQVWRFFLSARWAESWGMFLLQMSHVFVLSLSITLWPRCASARQLFASSPAAKTLQTGWWSPLHAHGSKFWRVWNKVHRDDLAFVQQKRMDDGDIIYSYALVSTSL